MEGGAFDGMLRSEETVELESRRGGPTGGGALDGCDGIDGEDTCDGALTDDTSRLCEAMLGDESRF